jgi:hypothetical protein
MAAALVAAVLVFGGGGTTAWSDSHLGSQPDIREWAEHGQKDIRTGMSLAPIIAFEPTFGTIIGGAVFLDRPETPRYRLASRLAFSSDGEYSVLMDIKRHLADNTFFHLEVEVDDFARPYYGEGMETTAEDRIMLEGTVSRTLFFLKCRNQGKLTMGPFLDFRGADLNSVDGSDIPVPEYEAATTALGFCVFYDGRDNHLSPTSGVYDTLTLRLAPKGLSSYEDNRTFFQAEVDHRKFTAPIAESVVGWRFYLAGSWGKPSYQYRYFLGGPYVLRGFYTNRFRGDKVYAVQVEGRREITHLWGSTVSLAAFMELGEATDNWFGDPKSSYGGGLRFTLPPDHVAKVRLDFAWAEDQNSIYFIFGEAF